MQKRVLKHTNSQESNAYVRLGSNASGRGEHSPYVKRQLVSGNIVGIATRDGGSSSFKKRGENAE